MSASRSPTALVTGSGGYLGHRIARSLEALSFKLAINDIDERSAVRLADSIADAVAFPADVSDDEAAAGLVADATARLGPIDVLVNAAGIEGPIGTIEDGAPAEVRRVFDVNVMSMFWLCRAVVPDMKERRKGRIINMASGAGLAGGALASPYHASKHAVIGLTRSLARELAPHQIAVNAVCPGYVDSPMVARIAGAETLVTGHQAAVLEAIPMGRMADGDEVATTVAFLAAEAPLYMTGSCLVIDGALRA